MFVCGKEEPITNNESLFQRKAGNPQLVPDQSRGISINRYSFVSKARASNANVAALMGVLLEKLGFNAYLVLCWPTQIPTKSTVASRVIESRYRKRGWTIYSRPHYYLAVRKCACSEIDAWPPFGVNVLDGGLLILIGDHEEVVDIVDDESYLFLARTRYFVPDKPFLLQLQHSNVGAIYQANDDLGNVGLVVLTGNQIDFGAIRDRAILENIFEGEESYKAYV